MTMPCVHEFGILDDNDRQENYIDYDPEKYNCISVHDDIIECLVDRLSIMKTYYHSFNRPNIGLAYCGITIIPPESLSFFYDVVTSSKCIAKSVELQELASIIRQAKEGEKYIIHFGI